MPHSRPDQPGFGPQAVQISSEKATGTHETQGLRSAVTSEDQGVCTGLKLLAACTRRNLPKNLDISEKGEPREGERRLNLDSMTELCAETFP